MSFLGSVSPGNAVRDLASLWRDNPYRWRVLALAMLGSFTVFYVAIPESERIPPRAPSVTYITSYAPDRTDEEILQSNIENQKLQDQLAEERAARDEIRRGLYRQLGQATGLDTDAMERQIAEEKAAEERAIEERRAAAQERAARVADE